MEEAEKENLEREIEDIYITLKTIERKLMRIEKRLGALIERLRKN